MDAWIPKIAQILRDPKNEEISISWGDLSIRPKLLNGAAEAYEQRLVPIIYDSRNKMNLSGIAEYKFQVHIVFIRSLALSEIFEKSTFLHESIHMLQERSGLKHALKLEMEIVAHLAQMMYMKLQGGNRSDLTWRPSVTSTQGSYMEHPEPLYVAWELAEFLLGPHNRKEAKTPLDDAATYHQLVVDLREAIRKNPSYASELKKPLADFAAF